MCGGGGGVFPPENVRFVLFFFPCNTCEKTASLFFFFNFPKLSKKMTLQERPANWSRLISNPPGVKHGAKTCIARLPTENDEQPFRNNKYAQNPAFRSRVLLDCTFLVTVKLSCPEVTLSNSKAKGAGDTY